MHELKCVEEKSTHCADKVTLPVLLLQNTDRLKFSSNWLHGPNSNKKMERLWEMFLKVAIAIILLKCLIECYEIFSEHPTYTDISQVDQRNAPFPAITLCPKTYNLQVLRVELPNYLANFASLVIPNLSKGSRNWT